MTVRSVISSQAAASHVGHLADLDPISAIAVICLRGLGREGFDLSAHLTHRFGAQSAAMIARCDDLAAFLARYGRRPLVRHSPSCPGLGADEAIFAQLVALALAGERDELLMMAMLICRADLAPCFAPLLEAFALTVQRALLAPSTTVH